MPPEGRCLTGTIRRDPAIFPNSIWRRPGNGHGKMLRPRNAASFHVAGSVADREKPVYFSHGRFVSDLANTPSDTPMIEDSDFDALMKEICVGWGYCGSVRDGKVLHVTDFIPATGPVSSEQFVERVFLADGMSDGFKSTGARGHRKSLMAIFVKHMGAEIVDAERLRYVG